MTCKATKMPALGEASIVPQARVAELIASTPQHRLGNEGDSRIGTVDCGLRLMLLCS